MILYGTPGKGRYTAGGKAEGLYRLRWAGVPVPDFLAIPAETFDPALAGLPADEPSAPRRRERLLAFPLPAADRQEVSRILAGWGFPGRPVVVRSSVAGEDGQQDAFPGMMDTFLNLTTPEAVWTAVARCAASAYSERAVAYRRQKGLTLEARPAVIIQQQVTPVASGVLFTTFPEYPQEMAIHATFGFGEGLVGGHLEADEFYYWKRTGQVHRRQVVPKEAQFVAAAGAGTAAVPLDPARRHQPALTDGQLEKLFALGSRLESELGGPLDIEFVVNGDEVWLVQARPVTQPIPEVVVYDNSNIQESYCGVTTPLTFSFARRAYATVYRQTMRTLGLPARTIRAQEGVVTALLGLVKGRIYYHINNWYRGLQLLPSFRQNKADMERMMGLEEPVDFVEDREKTALQKLRMLPGLLVNLSRLLWGFRGLGTRVPAFHAHFGGHYRRFYALDLAALDARGLLQQKEVLDRDLLQA
ncbi:MAG TPA: PEP/pyruvate-binding domain-containing protein, partial [Cytophagales bacterium]